MGRSSKTAALKVCFQIIRGLERITESELHLTRCALDVIIKRAETSRRIALNDTVILRQTVRCSRNECPADIEILNVRYVKYLPTELEFMVLVPRHCKCLGKSHVQCRISRQTEHVSVARFARSRIAERIERRSRVGKHVLRISVGPDSNIAQPDAV